MEGRERLAEFVLGDLVVVDVEALEHGLVEQSALLVVAAPVELLRILQEGQAGLDEPGVGVQVILGLVEPLGEVLTPLGDLRELLLDLGLGQCAVGGEVDEVGLLGVETPCSSLVSCWRSNRVAASSSFSASEMWARTSAMKPGLNRTSA